MKNLGNNVSTTPALIQIPADASLSSTYKTMIRGYYVTQDT